MPPTPQSVYDARDKDCLEPREILKGGYLFIDNRLACLESAVAGRGGKGGVFVRARVVGVDVHSGCRVEQTIRYEAPSPQPQPVFIPVPDASFSSWNLLGVDDEGFLTLLGQHGGPLRQDVSIRHVSSAVRGKMEGGGQAWARLVDSGSASVTLMEYDGNAVVTGLELCPYDDCVIQEPHFKN